MKTLISAVTPEPRGARHRRLRRNDQPGHSRQQESPATPRSILLRAAWTSTSPTAPAWGTARSAGKQVPSKLRAGMVERLLTGQVGDDNPTEQTMRPLKDELLEALASARRGRVTFRRLSLLAEDLRNHTRRVLPSRMARAPMHGHLERGAEMRLREGRSVGLSAEIANSKSRPVLVRGRLLVQGKVRKNLLLCCVEEILLRAQSLPPLGAAHRLPRRTALSSDAEASRSPHAPVITGMCCASSDWAEVWGGVPVLGRGPPFEEERSAAPSIQTQESFGLCALQRLTSLVVSAEISSQHGFDDAGPGPRAGPQPHVAGNEATVTPKTPNAQGHLHPRPRDPSR